MGSRADRPDPARVKLYLVYEQHRQFGKAFDENVWRTVLGLPSAESEGRAPLVLKESRARSAAVDISADAESLREQAEAVGRDAIVQENMDLRRQMEEMRAQLAELTGEPAEAPRPKPEPAKTDAPVTFTGTPQVEWTNRQIIDWAKAQGLELPPKQGVGMTKAAVLEHVLAQAAEREEAAAASAAS